MRVMPPTRAAGADVAGGDTPSVIARLSAALGEFYAVPYRRTFARARREEEDLFMMMVFSEALGVPNPAAFHTLELMPAVYERFHDWHRRMGMERSPLDHIGCC